MSNPRHTLTELRRELMELAEAVAPYGIPPEPDRFERDRVGARGPIWHIPQTPPKDRDWAALLVGCVDGEPGVYVEGAQFSYGGDWHALTTAEARSFGLALLAAAAYSDGRDELGQRRARKADEK